VTAMALCTAQFQKSLTGTVQTVHTVVGVATDDYNLLTNKPKINGVELVGDMTSDKLGFEINAEAEGDTLVIRTATGG